MGRDIKKVEKHCFISFRIFEQVALALKIFKRGRVAALSDPPPHTAIRGVVRGVRGNNFLGTKSLRRAPKSPNNFTSTFFNTVHLLPKDLRLEHGSATLASFSWRHLTLLRPCVVWFVNQCTTKWPLNTTVFFRIRLNYGE